MPHVRCLGRVPPTEAFFCRYYPRNQPRNSDINVDRIVLLGFWAMDRLTAVDGGKDQQHLAISDLDPKLLANRLLKVHNLGAISCTPQQMGVIQVRLGLSEGFIEDSSKADDPGPKQRAIGNIDHLVL